MTSQTPFLVKVRLSQSPSWGGRGGGGGGGVVYWMANIVPSYISAVPEIMKLPRPIATPHCTCFLALQEYMEEPSPDSTNTHPQGQHLEPQLVESQLPHRLPNPEGSRYCLHEQRPHPTPLDSQLPQQLPSAEHRAPFSHGEQSGRSSKQRTYLMLHASQLMQPLQTHMLPFLPLQSVAALRATCKTLQQLVDTAAEAWLDSASRWLPHKCLEHAVDSSTVQAMLRTQHRTILGLRRPHPLSSDHLSSHPQVALIDKTVVHAIQHDEWHRALEVQWAPAWPSPYIAVLLERDEDLVRPDIEEEELPDDAHAAILLETDTWSPLEGLDPQRPLEIPARRVVACTLWECRRQAHFRLHLKFIPTSGASCP